MLLGSDVDRIADPYWKLDAEHMKPNDVVIQFPDCFFNEVLLMENYCFETFACSRLMMSGSRHHFFSSLDSCKWGWRSFGPAMDISQPSHYSDNQSRAPV